MSDLADTRLIVTMTRGVAYETWHRLGTARRELAVYRALRPELAGVTLVTYGGGRDKHLMEGDASVDVVANRLQLPRHAYTVSLPLRLRGCRPALVKSSQVRGADVALRIAASLRAPFIARCGYLHSEIAAREHGAQSSHAAAAVALERHVFGGADAVVVTTDAMRAVVEEAYAIAPERVRVIPNFVDTSLFAPTTGGAVSRSVCFVGRLDHVKNVGSLIEALAGTDIDLVIAGDGPLRAELESKAVALGVAATFLGNVANEDLPAVIRRSTLFVLPSLYEGHPKVLIEAMACGAAVIASRAPGIENLIDDDHDGVLVEPKRDNIRDAVLTLVDDGPRRAQLGMAARRSVMDRFSLEKVIHLERQLYLDLVSEAR